MAAIKAARRETKDKRADARLKALELRAEGMELSEVSQTTGFHPATILPLFRVQINSFDKSFHKLFFFDLRCGMVNFIKGQQQTVDVIAGNLLLTDTANLLFHAINLFFDFRCNDILFIISTLQIRNLAFVVRITNIQGIHLPFQPYFCPQYLLQLPTHGFCLFLQRLGIYCSPYFLLNKVQAQCVLC